MSVYLPKHFSVEDQALLLAFMQAYSFVELIGLDEDGFPFVTHLPVVVRQEGAACIIEGHLALANPQGHWLQTQGRALLVFRGPHSYVSPRLYEGEPAVPTWNYTAVHATGSFSLVEEPEEKDRLLKGLIACHEPDYAATWRGFDEGYQQLMRKGIVGFRLTVDKLEGKFKLSQNRSAADRQRVQAAMAAGDTNQQSLAEWMTRIGIMT
ncbi:MAG TPA: FMN-binding negative transcriptional regulator [Rhodocyclaceae bacterium]|jgi:transcriptional regulator